MSKPEVSRKSRGPRVFLAPSFENWLTKNLGLTHSPLRSLESDDDWSFVIKMHALVEAGLNHLLLVQMNNPKLAEVIPKLPTRHRAGKMAFIRAYDLLTDDCCLFVQLLSD